MDHANTLVVFYSRSGFTRTIARELAQALGADLEELVDTKRRRGLLGYLRCGMEAALGRLTPLMPLTRRPEAYETIVVGTPIWNASISSPVRTFLALHKDGLKKVAFFCTYSGSGDERVFRQMEEVCGRTPLGIMAVPDREIGGPMQAARIREFAVALQPAAATQ
jgi:flavodoxin